MISVRTGRAPDRCSASCPLVCVPTVCPVTVRRDVRRGTPTPAGAVPGQRGRAAAGRSVRRAVETGGRATVPRGRAVRRRTPAAAGGGGQRVPVEGVAGVVAVLDDVRPGRAEQAGELPAALRGPAASRAAGAGRAVSVRRGTAARRVPAAVRSTAGLRRSPRRRVRFRLAAGRVARVFARVRQEGPADEARALLQPRGGQEGEPRTLRPEHAAAQKAQVQPAPVRRPRVVRGRSAEARAVDGRGRRGVRAERARPRRVGVLSRHADRPTRRVPDAGQRRRELFRDLRAEVKNVFSRRPLNAYIVFLL